MIQKILTYPDPELKKKSVPVTVIVWTPGDRSLLMNINPVPMSPSMLEVHTTAPPLSMRSS